MSGHAGHTWAARTTWTPGSKLTGRAAAPGSSRCRRSGAARSGWPAPGPAAATGSGPLRTGTRDRGSARNAHRSRSRLSTAGPDRPQTVNMRRRPGNDRTPARPRAVSRGAGTPAPAGAGQPVPAPGPAGGKTVTAETLARVGVRLAAPRPRGSARAARRAPGPTRACSSARNTRRQRPGASGSGRPACSAPAARSAAECLDGARARGERYGIWGGADLETERALRAAQATRPGAAAPGRV